MTPQTTIARPVRLAGAGLHTGWRARVRLEPAGPDTGRHVVAGNRMVPIGWRQWTASRLSTAIALPDGGRLRTVEHLMAALVAFGIDNVAVHVEGPELPIFDGSARPWCRALDAAGLAALPAPRRVLRIRRTVEAVGAGAFLRIEPSARFEIDVGCDPVAGLPAMRWAGPVDRQTFGRDLAPARSFGARRDRTAAAPEVGPPEPPAATRVALPRRPTADGIVEPVLRGWRPWRTSYVVGRRILPRPRFPDEPVRHLALDMIGDLGLAGLPLRGKVTARNPSHEKTYTLVAGLMADPASWEIVAEGSD